MSILRYISVGNKTLPSTEEFKEAAREVEKEIQKSQSTPKRGNHGTYSPQQRYEIGKYAAENSPPTAARNFQHYFRRSYMRVLLTGKNRAWCDRHLEVSSVDPVGGNVGVKLVGS